MAVSTTDELFDSLERARTKRCELLLKLLEFLKQMNFLNERNAVQDKAMAVLKSHVKKGGDLLAHEIPLDSAELFSQVLRVNKVPFYSSIAKDPDSGRDVAIFLTRDIDENAVHRAIELYVESLKAGQTELTLIDFAKKYEGMDTEAREGLSEAEVELFRTYMAKDGGNYAVEHDPDTDQYRILFGKEESKKVDKALRLTAFDFSGDEGDAFKDQVEQSLDTKHAFEKLLVPEPGKCLYVVDTMNPGRFVSIDENAYGMHNLRQVDEKMPDGGSRTVVRDDNSQYFPLDEKEMLMSLIEQLHEPVLLTEEEMSLVKEIAPNGVAILTSQSPEILGTVFSELKEKLTLRPDVYRRKQLADLVKPENRVTNLVDLPDPVIKRLEAMLTSGELNRTAVLGNSVSYETADRPAVEKVLHDMIYTGLEGLELTKTRLRYEGRGELDLSADTTQFLINTDVKGYVLKLNAEGLFIYNNNEPVTTFLRSEPGFENNVNDCIRRFPNIVVLTQAEFVSEEKEEIIKSRLPKNQNSRARAFLFNRTETERAELADGTVKTLTPRQAEAMQYGNRWMKKEYHISRGALELKEKTVTEDRIRHTEGINHAREDSDIEH